jgi:DNA (cytosine-5)-methyltransferase 1
VRKPRLLDLFCGAGGCSVGYHRAGFTEIVGVDINPQPRYPFEFVQGDALEYLRQNGEEFDAIHASPPCQHASDLRHMHKGKVYPELIEPTRELLIKTGKPYVIENVEGAKLLEPLTLCGSAFGLGAWCNDGKWHQLRRHRLFECSFFFLVRPCQHRGKPVGVYGNGGGNKARVEAGLVNGMTGTASERKEAMKIDWMTRAELSQAIPPAYTEFIGQRLMEVCNR